MQQHPRAGRYHQAARGGGHEHQPAAAPRVLHGDLLREAPAPGDAKDVEAVVAERVHHPPGERGEPRHGVRQPRRGRAADPGHAARIAGAIYGGTLRRQPELAAVIYDRAHAAPTSRRGYLYQLAASAGWTSLPWLRLVRQPALILAGDDDPIIPLANARLMAALLPDARLHVYPDGHLGLLTRAAELAPVVSDFLLAVETRSSRAVQ